MPPKEGVAVGRGGDAVSSEKELVVETDAYRQDVAFRNDRTMSIGL